MARLFQSVKYTCVFELGMRQKTVLMVQTTCKTNFLICTCKCSKYICKVWRTTYDENYKQKFGGSFALSLFLDKIEKISKFVSSS